MKCSHTGHPFPHRHLFFLTQENWTPTKFSLLHNLLRLSPPRGLSPLTHYLGGIPRPREDYHFSLTTLEDCHPLISPTITLGDYQPQHKVTCTSSVTPFPHNYSGLVVCFHSKGYGLGTLMAKNCTKH